MILHLRPVLIRFQLESWANNDTFLRLRLLLASRLSRLGIARGNVDPIRICAMLPTFAAYSFLVMHRMGWGTQEPSLRDSSALLFQHALRSQSFMSSVIPHQVCKRPILYTCRIKLTLQEARNTHHFPL